MTLNDYIQTLRKYWLAILALVIVGGVVGGVYAKAQPPLFRSTSSVLLSATRGESTSELAQGSNYVQGLVQTFALLAGSDMVLEPVIDSLTLETSSIVLGRSISADSPLNTAIIEISVVNISPAEAQRINTAVTESLADAVATVSPKDENELPNVKLTTINPATMPKVQFSPNTTLSGGLGAGVGLLAGIGLAFLRRILDTRVTDGDDLSSFTTIPLLGEVGDLKSRSSVATSIRLNQHGVFAESFRKISANLQFISVDNPLRTIVITSARAGEGKSSIAVGLALTLAQGGQQVLLIDADLRYPSVGQQTQLVSELGLTSVLVGEESLTNAVQVWGHSNLSVLTAGASAPNPNQLLGSTTMLEILHEAAETYDVVLLDSAPVGAVTDALWLGNFSDGVLLVVRERFTRRREVKSAIDSVSGARATIVGVVLNRTRRVLKNTKYYTTEEESRRTFQRMTDH